MIGRSEMLARRQACLGAGASSCGFATFSLEEILTARQKRKGTKFAVNLTLEDRGPKHWIYAFTPSSTKVLMSEKALPALLKCGPDEKLEVHAKHYWRDYAEPPSPKLDSISTTSRTATLVFEWLHEAFCHVIVRQGYQCFDPLIVFPYGQATSGDARFCQYRAVSSGLLPATLYTFEIVGYWRDEIRPSWCFPAVTEPVACPVLVQVFMAEGRAEFMVDTEHSELVISNVVTLTHDTRIGLYIPTTTVALQPMSAVRFCLLNLEPGANYRVHVQCKLFTDVFDLLPFHLTGPVRQFNLMELLGLAYGDWHDMELQELKQRWHRWLVLNHPDKNIGMPPQYVHKVIEKGGAAVNKMKSGKALAAEDFLEAKDLTPPLQLVVCENHGHLSLRGPDGTTHAVLGLSALNCDQIRKKVEKQLKAPAELRFGTVPLNERWAETPLRSAIDQLNTRARRVTATPPAGPIPAPAVPKPPPAEPTQKSSPASAPSTPSTMASPTRPSGSSSASQSPAEAATKHAPRMTLGGLLGSTFMQLVVESCEEGKIYHLNIASAGTRHAQQEFEGPATGLAALVHFDGLLPGKAYSFVLQGAEEEQTVEASFSTLQGKSPGPPPGLDDEGIDPESDADQEQTKPCGPAVARGKCKKRIYTNLEAKAVKTNRMILRDELLKGDIVKIKEDGVHLQVPQGWSVCLDLGAEAGWIPWCMRGPGKHTVTNPLPFGGRTWKLSAKRLHSLCV